MNIVQTTARFYPYIGGTEQVVYYLSRELVKHGHNVKVLCANEPAVGDSEIEGIKVRRLPYICKIANSNITLSLGKELYKEDFDILHTHLPHPWTADISAILSGIKNKPLFLTYHNDITGSGINKFIADFYNFTALRFLLKRAHKIFITNKNYLDNSVFLKPFLNKIVVSTLGVDTEKFRPIDFIQKKEYNSIFFLSRLDKFHRYKGLEYLLLSVKKIIDKIPLKLYIGGEGELLEYYKRIVKENRLEEVVNFLGFLKDEEVVNYYNFCDVFVLPSISSVQEGFGLVALEAMACRKPVIVTEIVEVAKEVKNNNAGIVVRSKDIIELNTALEYILSNETVREEMGRNAYEVVKTKYTWEKYADIVNNEYLKV